MSLADIKAAQENLEESFSKRMAELEAQLHSGGPSKDTVAKVAEEFRTFRELIFAMLGLLRQQINDCMQTVDSMETRHRKKALVFLGVPEEDKEDCRTSVLNIINSKLLTPGAVSGEVTVCHRIGTPNQDHHRPILVWFSNVNFRSAIWRAKTKLKGTSISVKEFLTKSRQLVFGKARQHFGLKSCWTQDGVIVIKTSDGCRHKITSLEELNSLTMKYAKAVTASSTASKGGCDTSAPSGGNNKARK